MNKKPLYEVLDWTVRRLKTGDATDYSSGSHFEYVVNVSKSNFHTAYGEHMSDSNHKQYCNETFCRLIIIYDFKNQIYYEYNNEYGLLAYAPNEVSSKIGFTDEYHQQKSINVE